MLEKQPSAGEFGRPPSAASVASPGAESSPEVARRSTQNFNKIQFEGELENSLEIEDVADMAKSDSTGKSFKTKKARVSPEVQEDLVIKIEHVHKTYLIGLEGVAALRGVSVEVNKGEFLCILGTSGGGKTTLLNIMGTIDKPTKGHFQLCGCNVKSNTKDSLLAQLRLTKIAFVFQTFNLISSMNAIENVELPMVLLGSMSRSEIRQRAVHLLERVGLGGRVTHFPNQLSGGEQQRVTIARALANDPEVLLLDEPTGDLDTKNSDLVLKILLDLHAEGKTLVMVTHDVALKSFANRFIRVLDGKILRTEEVSQAERMEAYSRLGDAEPMLRTGVNTVLTKNMPRTTYRSPGDYPCLAKKR